MAEKTSNQKTSQHTAENAKQAPATGPDGLAIAPPAYETGSIMPLQRKADPSMGGDGQDSHSPNRTGLPDALKAGIESLSSLSMDDVRVHYNSSKPAALQALAYTQGTDIHVARGQERHIPHEAWHVVQQKQGRVHPTTKLNGASVNTDPSLESEADRIGANLARRRETPFIGTSKRKTPSAPSEVIQGKFGFEVELGLALGWSDTNDKAQDKNKYSKPDDHLNAVPVAAVGNGFEAHLDHNTDIKVVEESSAIVELVTKPPIDESTDNEQAVRNRIKQMTDFVEDVSTKTNDLSERAKLGDIAGITSTSQKDGFLFVGGSEKGAQQLDTGYMQATYAIKIEKIPQMFAQVAKPENNINPTSRAAAKEVSDIFLNQDLPKKFVFQLGKNAKLLSKAWILETDAVELENKVYKSAWDENLIITYKQRIPTLLAELPQLMGYFSLIVNYLILGRSVAKHPTNSLRKNHLGLLYYKSRLSTLRNSLSAFSKWLLNDDELRDETTKWLQTLSNRENDLQDVQQRAFPATNENIESQVPIYDWLANILTGDSDTLFDQSKNAYSDEIAPYNVGKQGKQTIGTVVESRKVAPKGGYTYKQTNVEDDKYKELADGVDQSERDIGEWADIAVDLWKYLKGINDVE